MGYRNLRAELARNGIKNKELAELFGISVASASNLMNGKTQFSIKRAKILADRLQCDMEYLFSEDD